LLLCQMHEEEGLKFCLDTQNNSAFPLDLACYECLNVRSLIGLPRYESRKKKPKLFYILDYVLELIIKIWWFGLFFFKFWRIWVNFSMIFFLCIIIWNHIFQVEFWLNFAPKETLVWMDQCCEQCELYVCVCVFLGGNFFSFVILRKKYKP
jgi:hypothetical protein